MHEHYYYISSVNSSRQRRFIDDDVVLTMHETTCQDRIGVHTLIKAISIEPEISFPFEPIYMPAVKCIPPDDPAFIPKGGRTQA